MKLWLLVVLLLVSGCDRSLGFLPTVTPEPETIDELFKRVGYGLADAYSGPGAIDCGISYMDSPFDQDESQLINDCVIEAFEAGKPFRRLERTGSVEYFYTWIVGSADGKIYHINDRVVRHGDGRPNPGVSHMCNSSEVIRSGEDNYLWCLDEP